MDPLLFAQFGSLLWTVASSALRVAVDIPFALLRVVFGAARSASSPPLLPLSPGHRTPGPDRQRPSSPPNQDKGCLSGGGPVLRGVCHAQQEEAAEEQLQVPSPPTTANRKAISFPRGLHVPESPITLLPLASSRYSVRVALINLDGPPEWFRLQAPAHLTAQEAREFAGTTGAPSPVVAAPHYPFRLSSICTPQAT